jgi:hypothetical protein
MDIAFSRVIILGDRVEGRICCPKPPLKKTEIISCIYSVFVRPLLCSGPAVVHSHAVGFFVELS